MFSMQQVSSPRKRCAGFTLIEVMIVIGIFAVISSISYTALSQYISVQEKLEQKTDQLQQLQRAFTLLERDFRYLINRDIRGNYGDREAALLVNYSNGLPGEIIRFTTTRSDYALSAIGSVYRVAWAIEDNVLFRTTWNALNQSADTEQISLQVLGSVAEIEIEQYTWSATYGLQVGSQFSGSAVFPVFPSGIKITLTLIDGLDYIRVFDIANGT